MSPLSFFARDQNYPGRLAIYKRKRLAIFINRATILIFSISLAPHTPQPFNDTGRGIALEEFERKKRQYLKQTVEAQLQRDMAYYEKIKQIDNAIYSCRQGNNNLESQRVDRLFKDVLIKERDRLAREWLQALADDRILDLIRKSLE
jgi:hypothetical protein